MNVVIGQIWFEAETFSPVKTTLDDFTAAGLHLGKEVIDRAEASGEVSGFIEGAKTQPGKVIFIPTIRASSLPGGPVEGSAFEFLRKQLLKPIQQAGKIDGVLLSLHGAMAAEGVDDCEGELLAAVRRCVGAKLPLAISLDLHGNITRAMMDHANIIRGYHACPHVDMFETGLKAANILFSAVRGEVKPVCAWRKIPMLLQLHTTPGGGPFGSIYDQVKEVERQPGVLCASFFATTPYLDVPETGTTAVVCTNGDVQQAQKLADQLARSAWDLRYDLQLSLPSLQEGIERALKCPDGPVVLSDASDNILAGTTGDATALLKMFMEQDIKDKVFLPVRDPDAVARAIEAGLGQEVSLEIGGKLDTVFSRPVRVRGIVKNISERKVVVEGPVMQGAEFDVGRIVVLEVNNINILLTERVYPGHDPGLYRAGGLNPEEAKIVVVKSVNHAKANYAAIAKDYIIADAPGLSTMNLNTLPYAKAPRPIFPLDKQVELGF
jgi:microcystin degradation protein MlrC